MIAGVLDFFARAKEDVDAVVRADPAARSKLEVVLAYPGVHAVWLHRAAHALWRRGAVLTPRVLSHLNRFLTGVEIHPGAALGRRVFIDHGMGVVIGETAVVGDDCLIFKGAVLGGTSVRKGPRHPRLGRGVVVGTNSCVLGLLDIGEGARIGSGSVVIKDVPSGATVVGVPARVVERHAVDAALDLNHANLPDPVAQAMRAMAERIAMLESRFGVAAAPRARAKKKPARRAAGRARRRQAKIDVK